MINTIFYFPETKKQYEDELRDNGISSHTISFVEDTQEIYKNGKLYGNGKLTLSNILQAILDAEDTEDKFDGSKLEGVIDDMIDRRIHNVEKWVNTILQMIKNGHTEDILILGEGETVTRDGKRYIILYNKDGENITEEMIEKNYANIPKGSYYNRVDTILHFMNGILASTEETDPVKVLYSTGGNSNTSSMNSGSNPDDPNSEPVNPDDIQPGDSGTIKNDDNDPDRYIIGAVSLNPELVTVRVVEQPDPKDNYIKWDVIKNPEADTPVTIIVRYSVAPDELISIVVKHVAVTSVFVSGEKDTLIVPQETDLTATLTFDNTARNSQWLNDNTTVVWSSDLNNIIVTPKQDTKQAKAKASGQRKLDVTVTASVKVNDITEASGNYTIHVIPKPQEDINDPDINPDPSNPSSDGEVTIPEGLTIKNVTFEPAQARVHGVNSDYFIVDFTRGGSSFTYKATAIPDEDTNVKITVEYNETSDVTNVHVKVKGSGWPNSSVPDSITPTEPDGNGNYNIPIPEGLTIDYVERTYNPANPTVEGIVNENIVTLNYQKGGTTLTYKVTAQPDVNEVVTLTIHYEGATKTSKVTINLNGSGWTPIVVPQTIDPTNPQINNEDPDDNSGRVDLPNGLTIKKVTFTPLKTNVHGVESDYFNVSYTVGGTYFTYNTIATPDNETTVTITIEYNESDEISTVIVVVAGSNWTTPTPKTITLNKDNITLSENNTTDSITATVKDQYGNSMNNQTVIFELSNVNPTDVVSGLQNGNTYVLTADISKLSAGGDNGSATITAKLAGCADEVRNITITAPSQSSSPGGDEPGEPTNPSTPIIDGDDGSGDGTNEHPKEVENGDDGTINTDSSKDISSFQVYYGTSLNGPWIEENSNNKLINVTQVDTKQLSWTVIKNPDTDTYAKIHIDYTDGTSSDVYFLIEHKLENPKVNPKDDNSNGDGTNQNPVIIDDPNDSGEIEPDIANGRTVTDAYVEYYYLENGGTILEDADYLIVTFDANTGKISYSVKSMPEANTIAVVRIDYSDDSYDRVYFKLIGTGSSTPTTPEIEGGNGNGDGSDNNPKEVENGESGTINTDDSKKIDWFKVYYGTTINGPWTEDDGSNTILNVQKVDDSHLSWNVIKNPNTNTYAKIYIQYIDGTYSDIYFLIESKKATIVIAPIAIPNLQYTGEPQTLITAGEGKYGTMKYKLGISGEYSTNLPSATNGGSYVIYYKVFGNTGYIDSEEYNLTATIAGQQSETRVTEVIIDGLSVVPLNENEPTYTANVVTNDNTAYTGVVLWEVENGTGTAEIGSISGKLRTKTAGTITIKATAGDKTATKQVTIISAKLVSVTPLSYNVNVGAENVTPTARVYTYEYNTTTNQIEEKTISDTITWSTSNENVATVNASTGEISFVGQGECVITASATPYVDLDGITVTPEGSCAIKVDAGPSIDFESEDQYNVNLKVGSSKTIRAIVGGMPNSTISYKIEGNGDNNPLYSQYINVHDDNNGTATITAIKEGGIIALQAIATDGVNRVSVACHITTASNVRNAESITIDNKDLFEQILIDDQNLGLTYTVGPEDHPYPQYTGENCYIINKNAVWSSSNEGVLEINANTGDLTPKAIGTATITVTAENAPNVTDSITIEVISNTPTISSITIDGLSIVPLNEDEPRYTANITMSDGNQYTGNVSWSIQEGSDKASISASTGRLRAKKTGDIVIKVTAGEITQTKNVTIVAIKRVSVEPNMWGASLPDAEDKQLTATVYTMEYDDSTQSLKEVELADTVTWSSSNTDVATVNNAGLVHFVGVGECVISAATTYVEANGNTIEVSGSCAVKVTQESTGKVTMVDIDPQSMTMNIGESKTVTASVNQDARDYSIVFSVEQLDNCVRILNNNDGTATVTALKAGSAAVKATVTLDGNDNFVASCHVTILSPKSINIVLESPDDGIDALLSEEPMCYYSVYNEGGEPDTMPIDQWTKFYDGDTYKAKSGAIIIDQGLRILVSAGTVDGYDSPDEDIDLGYDEISDDIILTYFKDINASIKLYDASTNQLIDQDNIELSFGDTKTITAKVFIDNVEDSSKIVNYWRKNKVSGDGDIVDIEYIGNNCTITAIGYGTSTVSAVYGSHSKAVNVVVPDPDSQFHYVDLGLNTKWANMNLGASSTTDVGDGYLWGDPNSAYTAGSSVDNGWESEYYTTGAGSYSGDIQRGSSMDIAHSVLGGNWYTPSKENIDELISNTTMEFIDSENSKYLLVTSNINGNSIKIPYISNIKAQIQSTTTEYESSWSDVSSQWSGYYYTLTSEGQTRGGSKHFRAPVRAIYVE